MKVCFILGTRPEIIKLSPLIRAFQLTNIHSFIIHTNQHYSSDLNAVFFKELELPKPKYNLNVGSGSHGYQTGTMIIEIEKVLVKEKPDMVILEGDTNSVLAGSIAASKLHIKIAHIEAGLRSYFKGMPEEINRIATDHISDYLFPPTENAYEILIHEGIERNKLLMSGNTIVDAVNQNIKLVSKESLMKKFKLQEKGYFLLTLHREENVDNRNILKSVMKAVELLYSKYNIPIVFPLHPRTKKQLLRFKIKLPKGLQIITPLSFTKFLCLEKYSKLILTDSGGVQEEACILRVPCITLRENTERPETVMIKANILAGSDANTIMKSTDIMLKANTNWVNPFGDGRAAHKILNFIFDIK